MYQPRPRSSSTAPVEAPAPPIPVVAIDGPAAAGKSTVARLLAEQLGVLLFDTGALYRAVTLAALRADVSTADEDALARLARERDITVGPPSRGDGRIYDVRLDGEDVTWAIREARVDAAVSAVSAHPAVRAALLPVQRRIAYTGPAVIVGRDIGTAVVPDASVKVYLEASLDERTERRFDELRARGEAVTRDEVREDLARRDALDRGRAASPLMAATDATVVNTDGRTVAQVVSAITRIVRATWTIEPVGRAPDDTGADCS